MAARMAKGMDPLGALPSGSDSDADSDDAAPSEAAAKTAPANPTEAKIDYEALRKHGMKTAPTLEGIKDTGGGEGAWGWSRGSRAAGRDTMTGEELHEATGVREFHRGGRGETKRARRGPGATRGGSGDATPARAGNAPGAT